MQQRQGTLTPEHFGYSMPVDAPLYPAPPLRFQDAQFVVLTYETDADAAAAVLPAGLTLPLPLALDLLDRFCVGAHGGSRVVGHGHRYQRRQGER